MAERVGALEAGADRLAVFLALGGEEFADVFHRVSPQADLRAAHVGGGGEDGVDDRLVAGAAADIAGDRVDHLGPVGIGIAVEQRLGGDDHARGAEAALRGEAFGEGAAAAGGARRRVAMPSTVVTAAPFARAGERQAREHRLAIDEHGAGAAGALAAAGARRR